MFSYEKSNGKFHEFIVKIGEQWSKQEVKSQELNTIFDMIDDGDGILSEQEYSIFDRLLKMADGSAPPAPSLPCRKHPCTRR